MIKLRKMLIIKKSVHKSKTGKGDGTQIEQVSRTSISQGHKTPYDKFYFGLCFHVLPLHYDPNSSNKTKNLFSKFFHLMNPRCKIFCIYLTVYRNYKNQISWEEQLRLVSKLFSHAHTHLYSGVTPVCHNNVVVSIYSNSCWGVELPIAFTTWAKAKHEISCRIKHLQKEAKKTLIIYLHSHFEFPLM